jgi:hypothetical protein
VLLVAGSGGVALIPLDDVTVEEADPALSDAEGVHAASAVEASTNRPWSILIIFKDRAGPTAPRLAITDKKRGEGIEPSPTLSATRLRLRADEL